MAWMTTTLAASAIFPGTRKGLPPLMSETTSGRSMPVPGEVSGVDFHRLFRAIEWSQPFRGYDGLRATGYVVYK